jgi:hypothetical protein
MDLSVFPRREVLRWELFVRTILALSVPLLIGYALNGDLSGILAALIAGLASISYLGPDAGLFGWAVFAAVGTAASALLGFLVSGASGPVQLIVVFALFTGLGAAMLAGLLSQLAFTPLAMIGLLIIVLAEGSLTVEIAAQVCAGAGWALLLIAVLPRWSGWPRLPLPIEALRPDLALLRRMIRRPRWAEWGFPLLLGALATAVLVAADILNDGTRPYWAVLGLIGALGPVAANTRRASWQTVVGTVVGVVGALLLLALPLSQGQALAISSALGFLGVLVLLSHGVLSKAALTVLVLVMIAILTGDDPADVAGLRLIDYLIGAAVAMAAAGVAEYLAQRLEEDRPAEVDVAG